MEKQKSKKRSPLSEFVCVENKNSSFGDDKFNFEVVIDKLKTDQTVKNKDLL